METCDDSGLPPLGTTRACACALGPGCSRWVCRVRVCLLGQGVRVGAPLISS